MRFPFTFMGLLSLGMGVWMFIYLIAHPHVDALTGGLVMMSAFLSVAFGSFVVYRRFVKGEEG